MNISTQRNALFYALLFLLLTACAHESPLADLQDTMSEKISVSTSIGLFSSEMRVQINENGKGAFEEEDRISFFSNTPSHSLQNHVLTFRKGKWESLPTWDKIGKRGDIAKFTAYYPTLSSSEQEVLFFVSADQCSIEKYSESDLLGANASVQIPNNISLAFHHLMSRIVITLYSDDNSFDQKQLEDATVEIRSYLGGTIRVEDNQVGEIDKSAVAWVKSHQSGNSFSAILFPQPLSPFRDENAWIKIGIEGKTILYKAPDLGNGEKLEMLQSGSELKIRLNLQKRAEDTSPVLPDIVNKTLWVYGVTIPWTHEWLNERLSWHMDYGWFDCNKTNPGKGGSDSNLCWAASASNLIHWFLKHNEENIARYEKVSKKTFRGPKTYHNHIQSEVFNWFKQRHSNVGGDIGNGVNEYMLGAYISPGLPYSGSDIDTLNAGFLYDITGGVNLVNALKSKDRRVGIDKQAFNNRIKKALTEKEAIGFSIRQTGLTAGHAMTIWGADFDAKGDVSAIYITDNNDTFYGGLLWKKRIIYKNNTTELESSAAGYSDPIVALTLLGLGDSLWEAYFHKNR